MFWQEQYLEVEPMVNQVYFFLSQDLPMLLCEATVTKVATILIGETGSLRKDIEPFKKFTNQSLLPQKELVIMILFPR